MNSEKKFNILTMKKIVLLLTVLMFCMAEAFSQDYSYTLKKTMSPSQGNADYSFWKFPTTLFGSTLLHYGDTADFTIAVDMAKDNPSIPSLELKLTDVSGNTKSVTITGTLKASQFHLLTVEPTTGLTYATVSETVSIKSKTLPAYKVIADSVNNQGFVIPRAGVSHLRSVLYTLRLIPRSTTDTVKVTAISFKSWVNPQY